MNDPGKERIMNDRTRRAPVAALAALALALVTIGCQDTAAMKITQEEWGTHDDRAVSLYTLDNGRGLVAKITNYGGIVTELHVPDRHGNTVDVVLGFDTLDEYVSHNPYFGCMVGRVGNRIAGGTFMLDGRTYTLATNNGPNHLHGGVKGWDKVVWDAEMLETRNGPGVRLTYHAPDGEEGYPGAVDVTVDYILTLDNELLIDMSATTDAPTPINVVHHSYWNLAGHDQGPILDHELMLNAQRYTPADDTLIPTGAIEPVAGTPYDFTTAKAIGADIDQLPPSGDDPGGYDLNYVVDGTYGRLRRAAVVRHPASGRRMEIWSTMPGIQFYTGNFLDGVAGRGGAVYEKHAGFCLETQHFPDAVNKRNVVGWHDPVIRPGQAYRHRMVHRFSGRGFWE
jgi:aldose 1-epimerase